MSTNTEETFEVSKISTNDGHIFYTRETDRSKLRVLPGVQRIEDTQMTEAQFNAIPSTEESRAFFAGLAQEARSE